MRDIIIDTETFYRDGKDGPSVKNMGNWQYTHHPEFEVLLVSVCDGEQSWAGPPERFNWDALDGARLIAHNAGFDSAVIRRLQEDGVVPKTIGTEWCCSADMSAYLFGERSLKGAMLAGFNMDVSKDVRDAMAGLRTRDLVARGLLKSAAEYARSDAVNEWHLWSTFSPSWPDVERRISQITLDQRARGIRVDVPRLDHYIASLKEAVRVCESNLPWVEHGYKPTSTKGIYPKCREVGIPCPPLKKDSEEEFVAWESTYRVAHPWVALIGNHRSITKILANLELLKERMRPDGVFHPEMMYFGSHTGRWTSSGFNVMNMRKTPLVVDMRTGAVIEWPTYKRMDPKPDGAVVIDVRSLFVPGDGNVWIDADLAQIEPRVLNWFAKNDDVLEAIRGGMSIYEVYARKAGRWTEPHPLKTGDPKKYAMAKMQVLQLGYRSGAKKFRAAALSQYDTEISEEQAQAAVDEYRSANPNIVGLWRQFDDALIASVGDVLEVGLPRGGNRMCRYERIIRVLKEMKIATDAATGETRTVKRWETMARVKGDRRPLTGLHGGVVTENVVQATSRDVFIEGVIRLENLGFKTAWPIHDQIMTPVAAAGAEEARKAVEDALSVTPEWLPGCPVAAEADITERYLIK